MMTLEEYRLDLESEIGASAVASEQFKAESFTQVAANRLQEAEELSDFNLASISGAGKSRKDLAWMASLTIPRTSPSLVL